jgi:hypothetical protein
VDSDELFATINLIKSTDFKVEDVNINLHKCVAATIAKGHSTSHNMCESDMDGDQDLTLWLRSLEDVLRELLGDDIHTYDRHMIDISQNGRWHMPEWKVAYAKMKCGIYQSGKWQMPKWKIYQSGKWHIPDVTRPYYVI